MAERESKYNRIEDKQQGKELKIWVHTLTGRKYHIDVTNDENLDDLKEFMVATFNIPKKEQRYIYQSTLMTCDMRTLGEYEIKEHEILHLVVKVRGGAKTKQNKTSPLHYPDNV